MPTSARRAFDSNCADIDRLLEIHKQLTPGGPGRKYDVEVLHKSGIVLITAFWEAYCEDLAAEALEHLIAHGKDASCVPVDLRKIVAKEFKKDGANELAAWDLADDGWRTLLQTRLATLQATRNRNLNTPKSANIDELFLHAVGAKDVSKSWRWSSMTAVRARNKLDDYIELRGEVAHRGAAAGSVRKTQVKDYLGHIKQVVSKTGGRINTHVNTATGKKLF